VIAWPGACPAKLESPSGGLSGGGRIVADRDITTRAVVRAKGQVTIPQQVRDALHVGEGDWLVGAVR
jgi:hypothetical protein